MEDPKEFLSRFMFMKEYSSLSESERTRVDEVNAQNNSRGFGDTVAKFTSAFGITPCGGCKQRQAYLNNKFPYRK